MTGAKQVLVFLGAAAVAALPSSSAHADEGRPLPVSCLYLRSQPGDEVVPGKGNVVYQAAFYPALEEEFRATPPDSMAAVALLIDWEDFPSHPLTYTQEHFDELLFRPTEEGDRSMRDYYEEVSAGRFALGGAVSEVMQAHAQKIPMALIAPVGIEQSFSLVFSPPGGELGNIAPGVRKP